MKIVYTIAGFYRKAGMERILADKVNYLAQMGHSILIVTTDQNGRDLAFPLEQSIKTIDLGICYEDNNGGSFVSKLVNYPIKKLEHHSRLESTLKWYKPDVTVSMFCGDETFLPDIKDGSKKVLEVHFSRYKRIQYGRKGLWAIADHLRSIVDGMTIERFDRFVVLTEEDYSYWKRPSNGCVIPNFISQLPEETSSLNTDIVLAVGRFCHQKGFDRLLSAWAIVSRRLQDDHGWLLRIVGDGDERDDLEQLADSLGIGSSVRIDYPKKDMDQIYRQASVLALSSRYEGFPLVLLEAQSYGLPIVSFDCKCGPKDIISHMVDGLLVPDGDIHDMAEALFRVITNRNLRTEMGQNAREHAAHWDKEETMKLWINLFENI